MTGTKAERTGNRSLLGRVSSHGKSRSRSPMKRPGAATGTGDSPAAVPPEPRPATPPSPVGTPIRAPSPSLGVSPRKERLHSPVRSVGRRPPSSYGGSMVRGVAGDGAKQAPPKPWWEYEEQLARLAFELRGEAAAQRTAHTKDLGILLQQQLALRSRVDEMALAFNQYEGAFDTPDGRGRSRLAAAVAETANDAQALQLTLLERGAASLRLEADSAQLASQAAQAEAMRSASEVARLHSQMAHMSHKLRRAEAKLASAEARAPPTTPSVSDE